MALAGVIGNFISSIRFYVYWSFIVYKFYFCLRFVSLTISLCNVVTFSEFLSVDNVLDIAVEFILFCYEKSLSEKQGKAVFDF